LLEGARAPRPGLLTHPQGGAEIIVDDEVEATDGHGLRLGAGPDARRCAVDGAPPSVAPAAHRPSMISAVASSQASFVLVETRAQARWEPETNCWSEGASVTARVRAPECARSRSRSVASSFPREEWDRIVTAWSTCSARPVARSSSIIQAAALKVSSRTVEMMISWSALRTAA